LAPPVALRKKPRISVESQRFSTLKGYATASAAALTGDDHEVRRRLEGMMSAAAEPWTVLSSPACAIVALTLGQGGECACFAGTSPPLFSGIGLHLTRCKGWA